jgi:hypothetical protein
MYVRDERKLAMPVGKLPTHEALPGFFRCSFSSLTCLKKPIFSKGDFLRWKVIIARLYGIF